MSTLSVSFPTAAPSVNDRRVFWGCFTALVTCAFGFAVRAQVIGNWAIDFNLSETEKGSILAVGFWPFAFSIFALSFVLDKVGFGRIATFGFLLHLISTIILVTARNKQMLYWGTFLFALSNGTVEAYINAAVASMYTRAKTTWLNILHAGWPAGMAVAGMIAILMGDIDWRWKVALTFVPTAVYAVLLMGTRFPISERVAAGISYRRMLGDFGALGAFVGSYMICVQALNLWLPQCNPFGWSFLPAVVIATVFGLYVRSLGRPLYFFLLLVMLPLATTELGIDSWISDLMKWILHGDLVKWNLSVSTIAQAGGWVFVYTAVIMTVLRFLAGPIIHRLTPLGLLAICALLAILGLSALSVSTTLVTVFLAATVYGCGKSFFWPTMLGVVSEKCPRGGAVTLNCIGGVGMLGLSVGGVFLGFIQDTAIDRGLAMRDRANGTALHQKYVTVEKDSILGKYRAVNRPSLDDALDLYEYKTAFQQNPASKGKDLKDDKTYQRLVSNAVEHLRPTDPGAQAPMDKRQAFQANSAAWEKAQTYDKKLDYLLSAGILVDPAAFTRLQSERNQLDTVTTQAKQSALLTAAVFPSFMLVCYVILILYFKAHGGYRVESLEKAASPPGQ
jgi:MFS family permease